MAMRWPWAKTYEVKCPDGTVRIVHRRIEDACPLFIPGWKADVGAEFKGIDSLTATARAKYETHIHGLLFALNEQNESLMLSFRTVYVAYLSNPCKNDGFFRRELEKLLDEQRKISQFKVKISALIQLINSSPGSSAELAAIFRDMAGYSGQAIAAPVASTEIAETRLVARELMGGP